MSEGRTRVLFVDDEENILKALRRLFRRDPWEQRFASSGREALDLMEAEGPFDVVVTDQRMPGMTGVELLTEVRARAPRAVRIILSGYTEVQSILDAINRGAIYKFLTKPWDDHTLREVVEEAVESVELRRENERLQGLVEQKNAELAGINRCLQEVIREGLSARKAGLAHAVVEALPVGVLAVGADGTVALANREACRLLALGDPEAALGAPAPATLAGGDGLAVRAAPGVRGAGWEGAAYVLWEE
ncbi:MAG: hypothetical protein Kow0092_03360 [Deferrisomatales bacterium]